MTLDEKLARDYQEAANYFRVLADARLKLLAFVPVLAGAAISLLPKREPAVVLPLSVLGFLVTLGILIYDLRNTQIYDNLLRRLKALEAAMEYPAFKSSRHRHGGAFLDRPPREWCLYGITIWHDLGLAIIYSAALGAWSYLFFYALLSTVLTELAAQVSGGLGIVVAVAFLRALKRFGLPIDDENEEVIANALAAIAKMRACELKAHNTEPQPDGTTGAVPHG